MNHKQETIQNLTDAELQDEIEAFEHVIRHMRMFGVPDPQVSEHLNMLIDEADGRRSGLAQQAICSAGAEGERS